MGWIPTHGSSCRKKYCYPCNCKYCGELVIYNECTCESRFFLEPPDRGVHICPNMDGQDLDNNKNARSEFKGHDIKQMIDDMIRYMSKVVVSTYGSPVDGKWVNSRGVQKFYHRTNCKFVRKINRIARGRLTIFDAEKKGYARCRTCFPSPPDSTD